MEDYPEACLLCLVYTNHACPVYMAPKEEFSCLNKRHPPRTVLEMKKVIANAHSDFLKGQNQKAEKSLQKYSLRPQTVSMNEIEC